MPIIKFLKSPPKFFYILHPYAFSVWSVHAQSCLSFWDPTDCSPSGSSLHGILQARKLEWDAIPSFRGSSLPRDQTHFSCFSCIPGGFFTTKPPVKAVFTKSIIFLLNLPCFRDGYIAMNKAKRLLMASKLKNAFKSAMHRL